MLLWSCHEKYDQSLYNLRFHLNHWIEIDFNSRETKIEIMKYKDSLILTKKEEQSIKNSYIKNKIYDFYGDKVFCEELPVMPPIDLIISVNIKGKTQANITISDRLTSGNNMETKRIIKFRDDLMSVLENNESFKKVQDTLYKYIKENKIILL